jgi:hypothetical protein
MTLVYIRGSAKDAVIQLASHEFAWRTVMAFNVKDVVSQALEANEVVQRLPGHAGNGVVAHQTEYDDTFFRHYVRIAEIPRCTCAICAL